MRKDGKRRRAPTGIGWPNSRSALLSLRSAGIAPHSSSKRLERFVEAVLGGQRHDERDITTPEITLQLIAKLGLMFRATALNQLSAKVQLARRHYSPARFTAALTGISNRTDQLANRFTCGRMSLEQLQSQAHQLARQDVLLYEIDTQAESQPAELASSFHRLLARAYLHAKHTPRVAVKRQLPELQKLLAPSQVRSQARQLLSDAFWKGHLSTPIQLHIQVMKLAHLEAIAADSSQADRDHLELCAAQEIQAFIAAQQPEGIDTAWLPQQRMLHSPKLSPIQSY